MQEAALVILGLLALVALSFTPGPWALAGGVLGTSLALVLGTAAGFVYHLRLHQALAAELPKRWWWNPTAYHDQLDDESRARVMPWFYGGAFGFLGCIFGLAWVVAGLVRAAV